MANTELCQSNCSTAGGAADGNEDCKELSNEIIEVQIVISVPEEENPITLSEVIIGKDTIPDVPASTVKLENTSGSGDPGSVEVDSLLLEEEEVPTTSASSMTTGSLKVFLDETFLSIIGQISVPLLISGFGMIGAGFYLDHVQDWKVFQDISQLFILIPALVGLKGNLEMTLASRLSTQANLGTTNNLRAKVKLTIGNLCLVQCQAIVLSTLASIIALVIGGFEDGQINVFHGLVLFASSLATASLASFGLGLFTAAAVFTSSAFNINPDNIAAPLAASLGDIVTLFCLANLSSFFEGLGELDFGDTKIWIVVGVLGFCLLILPLCLLFAYRSKSIRPLFKHGWWPIIAAVAVSSVAGFILKIVMVKISPGIAVFQPVFCGIGGNIAAIQASRISTSFHSKIPNGILPEDLKSWIANPFSIFSAYRGNSIAARALVVLAIPGHMIFFCIIQNIGSSHSVGGELFPFYLAAAAVQAVLMLYAAEVIVNLLWTVWKKDPDSEAIPYLTAFGDVIGLMLLGIAFMAYQGAFGSAQLV